MGWSQFFFYCFHFFCFGLSVHLLGFGKWTHHLLLQDEGPRWPKVTCPWQVNSNVKARSGPWGQLAALSHKGC